MRLLDISFRAPEQNLAFDEVLLAGAEAGRTGETLRFWESPVPCVVLGVAQVLRQQVYQKRCDEDGIPILRRCSAGGCVLQGPGCLNYSLVLSYANHPGTRTIRGAYCYVLGRIAEAFRERALPLRHSGVSDLSLRGKKVSGNAQKRRRHCFLHHGTLLYGIDPQQMERYLPEPGPQDRPRYRGDRTHCGFATNLPMDAEELRDVVCGAFEAPRTANRPHPWELKETARLVHEKYATLDWIHRR